MNMIIYRLMQHWGLQVPGNINVLHSSLYLIISAYILTNEDLETTVFQDFKMSDVPTLQIHKKSEIHIKSILMRCVLFT